MSQESSKVSVKEINNQSGGKSGAKVPCMPGPARGGVKGNASNGGGIAKPTKGI